MSEDRDGVHPGVWGHTAGAAGSRDEPVPVRAHLLVDLCCQRLLGSRGRAHSHSPVFRGRTPGGWRVSNPEVLILGCGADVTGGPPSTEHACPPVWMQGQARVAGHLVRPWRGHTNLFPPLCPFKLLGAALSEAAEKPRLGQPHCVPETVVEPEGWASLCAVCVLPGRKQRRRQWRLVFLGSRADSVALNFLTCPLNTVI